MPATVRSGEPTDVAGPLGELAWLEAAAAAALAALRPGGAPARPLAFTVHWLAAPPAGASLLAEAEVVQAVGDLAWVEGVLLDTEGMAYARLTASYRLDG